jgi:hypothetical protein
MGGAGAARIDSLPGKRLVPNGGCSTRSAVQKFRSGTRVAKDEPE